MVMSASLERAAGSAELERYKLLLDGWRRERALSMQTFAGFAVAAAILALISLSGAWWAAAAGVVTSVVWLAAGAQLMAQQDYLYARLEEAGGATADAAFHTHRSAEARVRVARIERAGEWTRLVSRYAPLGVPAVLSAAWLIGLIVALFS